MTGNAQTILRKFDDGLILRRASAADASRVADFNAMIHGENEYDAQAVSAWTKDLMTGSHPTCGPEDFTIVEDPASGKIVSALCTISQTWLYGQTAFGVGRPELVGTLPEYRNRGLIRTQFEAIHEWSRERGELIQVITGIPYFYRQFGYEMAIDLSGGRAGYVSHVPTLPEGQDEKYLFRAATQADIPLLMQLYQQECARNAVSALWTEADWHFELYGKNHDNVNRLDVRVIETRDGQPVGYIAHPWFAWGAMQALSRYELLHGFSYQDVTQAVIRYLWNTGKITTAQRGKNLESFGFWCGSMHPAYEAVPYALVRKQSPYAFYVRVPDLPAFFVRIAPELEARLSESVCAGYSGEVKISFYRRGICLAFENGKLVSARHWSPVVKDDEGSAAFPDLTFLQLAFRYRSLDDICYAFPDCWADKNVKVLLNALFPKKSSDLWAIS